MQRSARVLEDLAAKAPADVLEAALVAPDPVGGVAAVLSKLAAARSTIDVDPLLDAIARGAEVKSALLTQAGGTWTAGQVAESLGISRQAVDKRRTRGALLAVPSGAGDHRYPRCQFTERGVIPHLEQVLRAFRVRDPWTQLSTLLGPSDTLGRSVLDALRKGDVDGAVAAVRSIGDTHDDAAPAA
ncbi:MAG: DNA-binding protein [Gemmatimonadales bacterium]